MMIGATSSLFSVLLTSSPYELQRTKLVAKLRAMVNLKHGWSYGQGEPVSPFAVSLGETCVMVACDAGLKADVFPEFDGGCAVAAYGGDDRKVEILIHPSGQFDLKHEQGFGFQFEDVATITDARFGQFVYLVGALQPHTPWKSSGFLTSETTIPPQDDSVTSSTAIPRIQPGQPLLTAEGGSQSLTPAALAQK